MDRDGDILFSGRLGLASGRSSRLVRIADGKAHHPNHSLCCNPVRIMCRDILVPSAVRRDTRPAHWSRDLRPLRPRLGLDWDVLRRNSRFVLPQLVSRQLSRFFGFHAGRYFHLLNSSPLHAHEQKPLLMFHLQSVVGLETRWLANHRNITHDARIGLSPGVWSLAGSYRRPLLSEHLKLASMLHSPQAIRSYVG